MVTTLAFPDPKANLSAVFGAAHTMKRLIPFCTVGLAALCAVPAQAVPVDCWWGDPRKSDGLKPYNCDITRRIVDGQKYLDVLIPGVNKHFSLRMSYEKKKDGFGNVTWYHRGKQLPGFWQFDKDGDIELGVKGYKTNFAFDGMQFVNGMKGLSATPAVRETSAPKEVLSDTPFVF